MADRFRTNNFDLLRFLFASTVMLVHAYVLSGQPQLAWLSEWLSSEIAVKAFFVVSGLLVFMSFDKSRSLGVYAEKRVRRIYPAYFTVVVCCAALLFLVSTDGPGAYFSSGFFKYLAANLVFLNFLHPVLPGVFEGNALREVNGALWTLKIEVMFYLSVPIIAWLMNRLGRFRMIIGLYVLSVSYASLLYWLASKTGSQTYVVLARQFPGQLSYFMVGAFFYYYLRLFERRVAWFAAGALTLAVLHRFVPTGPLEPLWLGTLVAFFGFFLYAGNFGRYGDFSYGIYILHFPILQTLIYLGLFAYSPYLALGLACSAVLAAAALMWHLVEKRYLNRGSHYVEASAMPVKPSSATWISARNLATPGKRGISSPELPDDDGQEGSRRR